MNCPIDEPLAEGFPVVKASIAESFTPPVRLPSLSSAELEHADDTRLDDAYEEKLRFTGDDLLPIKSVDTIVEIFLGVRNASVVKSPQKAASSGVATAAAPAFDVAKIKDEIAPKQVVELPVLGSDPTEAELLEYANAHPSVQAAKRIFRAKIVEVKKA